MTPDPDQIMELQDEVEQLRAEVACLRERQEVHLRQIANLAQTVPLESEVAEALHQRGALLAEIGTLRSVLRDARAWIPSTVHDETNNDTWTGTVKTNPMLLRIDAVLGSTK